MKAIFLLLCCAIIASSITVSPSDSARTRSLLHSGQPFVVAVVPREFLNPSDLVGDEVETQSDWAHYLDQWRTKASVRLLILTTGEYRKLFAEPTLKRDCLTLFVRSRKAAAYYDTDCVATPYDEGTFWMSGKRLLPKSLHSTEIELR